MRVFHCEPWETLILSAYTVNLHTHTHTHTQATQGKTTLTQKAWLGQSFAIASCFSHFHVVLQPGLWQEKTMLKSFRQPANCSLDIPGFYVVIISVTSPSPLGWCWLVIYDLFIVKNISYFSHKPFECWKRVRAEKILGNWGSSLAHTG